MASRAHLQPVPSQIDILSVIGTLNSLRSSLDALAGEHDGIDISLNPKGTGLDVIIHAKVNSDPSRLAFRLETQPVAGVFFANIEVRADPKAHHRKLVIAKINAALPA